MAKTVKNSPDQILESFAIVATERELRARDGAMSAKVIEVKRYQRHRFENTYADLLCSPSYGAATRFFLNDLYGPQDFTRRDKQFLKIVPALRRLFPDEVVSMVDALARLHALSESLDTAMAVQLPTIELTEASYSVGWRAVGRRLDRESLVELTLFVGACLDRYTSTPLLCHSLRLMRLPARAAGLSELQVFLETGFEAFRKMGRAQYFLETIAFRERQFMQKLFFDGATS